jgi:hypothetical protein
MAIVNRDLDVSQRKVCIQTFVNSTVGASAGAAFPLVEMSFPCQVKAIELAAVGLSGSPQIAFDVQRFVAGAGLTTIPYLSTTLTVTAYSVSGYQAVTLAAAGSTLLQLQRGDVITVNQLFSGGNVAVQRLNVGIVVQALQDIVQQFGSST